MGPVRNTEASVRNRYCERNIIRHALEVTLDTEHAERSFVFTETGNEDAASHELLEVHATYVLRYSLVMRCNEEASFAPPT
jgi:hypothetical protein